MKPSNSNRGQLAPIETKLRANIAQWMQNLETVGKGIEDSIKAADRQEPAFKSWHTIIYRAIDEMNSAKEDLRVVAEDLTAAEADARYRSVLVSGWPTNHFLDRLSYLGTALFGAGGAAFVYGVGLQDPVYRFVPAVALWALGLILLTWSLRSLSDCEYSRWRYVANELAVPEEFHPRMFRDRKQA